MSEVTMRAGATAEEVDAYVAGLLELLGERDPLTILSEGPDAVRREVAACPPSLRRVAEGSGKWSVAEVVRHLADMEGIFWYRFRRTLSQPGAAIQPVDQDAWARAQDYAGSDLDESLDELERMRELNLRWLRRLRPEDWQVAGVHAERGRESIERMVRLLAGHDLAHLRQIRRIRETVLLHA